MGRQVAQSVEQGTLEAEVRGSKPVLGTWWCGRIPPNQPYSKVAAAAGSTLLVELWSFIPRKGVNIELFPHLPYSPSRRWIYASYEG